MSPSTLLYIIISILSFDFIVDHILDYLNIKNHKKELPPEVSDIYESDKYQKSIDYHKVNYRFDLLSSGFSFLLITTVILTGTFGKLDHALREKIENPVLEESFMS
jgi:STE24 endopeptidase